MNGVGDILGVMPDGKFFTCEMKSATGKASTEQIHFHEEVTKRNGLVFICDSVDKIMKMVSELEGHYNV